jgi:hypothetical protein
VGSGRLLKAASFFVKLGATIAITLSIVDIARGLLLLASGDPVAPLLVAGGVVFGAFGLALAKASVPEPPENWRLLYAFLLAILLAAILGPAVVALLLALSIAGLIAIYKHESSHPEAHGGWEEPAPEQR